MSYAIKIQFSEPSQEVFRGRAVHRIRCDVIEAVDMPEEIFLHQKSTVDPETQTVTDEMITICDPLALSKYPANTPDENLDFPFFRLNYFDIYTPGPAGTEEVKRLTKERVALLIQNLTKLDEIADSEDVWIPSQPNTTTTTTTTTTPAP
jgi:hypothetical protein